MYCAIFVKIITCDLIIKLFYYYYYVGGNKRRTVSDAETLYKVPFYSSTGADYASCKNNVYCCSEWV